MTLLKVMLNFKSISILFEEGRVSERKQNESLGSLPLHCWFISQMTVASGILSQGWELGTLTGSPPGAAGS